MSRLDDQMRALSTLAQRPTWKLEELPGYIDADILTALDAREWVEFSIERVHRESDSGWAKERVFNANPPGSTGRWFSPARDPEVAGTVAEIMLDPFSSSIVANKYGAQGPCIDDRSELRLTPDGRDRCEQDATKPQQNQACTPPLTDSLREVWDKLDGKAMQAAGLAKACDSNEDAIRQRIKSLRAKGYAVENAAAIGYYRPDAKPSDFNAATPIA